MVINSLKKSRTLLLSIISLFMAITVPAICFADADRIFKENNKAVVIVITYDDAENAIMQGSGFIVRPDGVVVTNYHVISNARSIRIKAGHRVLNVDGIISLDKDNDIAILKVDAKNLHTVKLGNLAKTEIGEKVYIISSPQGLENTISDGILSGKRELAPRRMLLQITAPISPGSSGGPVFNKNGEVIGVATYIFKESQNLNFAMPVDTFKSKIASKKLASIEQNQIENYEKTPEYWFNRGIAYFGSDKLREARDAFTKAIELKPDYAEAYVNRGDVYAWLENDQQRIKDYTKAIELKPDYAEAYVGRGLVYGTLKNYKQAIQDFTKAIKLKPDYAEAYVNRGGVYEDLENYKQAVKDYTKAIKLKPNYWDAYHSRGNAYMTLGNYQEAIKDHTKVIELVPNSATGYYWRGNAYKDFGNYPQAIKDYNKAIELKPDDQSYYYNRGIAYSKLGNDQHAMDDLKIAAKLGDKKAQDFLMKLGIQW